MLLNDLVWIMNLPLLNRTGGDNFVIESHTMTARDRDEEMAQR